MCNQRSYDYVYGPVPSRRMGISLGIDPVPKFTCTYNCIYCQLGATRNPVSSSEDIEEGAFPKPSAILTEVKAAVEDYETIDYVTFSGSGEPTLSPFLEEVREGIREITDLPVALITNSSLLANVETFEMAKGFDLIVPSLDAGDQETFMAVNRPAGNTEVSEVISALSELRKCYSEDRFWVEVMLIKSKLLQTNTGEESLANLRTALDKVAPGIIHLNTCVRPPAEDGVLPLEISELEKIGRKWKEKLKKNPRVIPVQKSSDSRSLLRNREKIHDQIIKILEIRPSRTSDIIDTTGFNPSEVSKHIQILLEEGEIRRKKTEGEIYYFKD
ncbi:MAG: radical SAM protein [Candidatus Acetothermia bacterium]